jgi:hypothetical protein
MMTDRSYLPLLLVKCLNAPELCIQSGLHLNL